MGSYRFLIFLALSAQAAFLVHGQEWPDTKDVNIPVLGAIQGRRGETSKNQTRYYTFHGIPYALPESYTGSNRFKPAQVWANRPLKDDGTKFEANRILVYCPQGAVFDLGGLLPKGDEPKELVSKAQNLPEIFRAIHQRKRRTHALLREIPDTKDRMQAIAAEGVMGIEDCLTINVNTPFIPDDPDNVNDDELLPVVVFFHGGGSDSVWGSAFTALRMLEYPVVLVTMNYRLGVLGAFNLGTDDAPGCAGLYDGITSLEWVQKYIKYFGGNPDLVTISGQSAGSMMVTNLLITPLTKGLDKDLFHRVWGFSGTAISVWAVARHPSLDIHLRIAEIAGCYNKGEAVDKAAIVSCMQNADQDTLVNALSVWKAEEEKDGRLGYDARMPSIQSPDLTIPIFMPEHPYDALENFQQRPVPVVVGATKHDGSYPLDDIYNNFLKPSGLYKNETFLRNDLFPTLLKTLGINDDTGELYHAMAKAYLGNASTTGTLIDKLPGMMDMVTVMAFKAGEYELLKFQSKLTEHAYMYSLDYYGRWSLYNFLWGEMYMPGGICHTDDLIYFFWLGPLLNEDMKVSRRWMEYFINFVKHGNPNGLDGDKTSPQYWQPYDPITHPFMSLNRHDKVLYNAPDHWIGASQEIFDKWVPPPDEEEPPTGPTEAPTGGPTDPTHSSEATTHSDGGAGNLALSFGAFSVALISTLMKLTI